MNGTVKMLELNMAGSIELAAKFMMEKFTSRELQEKKIWKHLKEKEESNNLKLKTNKEKNIDCWKVDLKIAILRNLRNTSEIRWITTQKVQSRR